jgi:hypothetical protein
MNKNQKEKPSKISNSNNSKNPPRGRAAKYQPADDECEEDEEEEEDPEEEEELSGTLPSSFPLSVDSSHSSSSTSFDSRFSHEESLNTSNSFTPSVTTGTKGVRPFFPPSLTHSL